MLRVTEQAVPQLTPREREVLDLLCRGIVRNRAIATRLVISEMTVHYHVNNLMQKLEATNRTELVVRAYGMGLVNG